MIEPMKAAAKSLMARLMYGARGKKHYAPHGSIVLFHRVNDEYPNNTLTVSRASFASYLKLFRSYFDVVPLADFVGYVSAGSNLSGKLCITFDDGYLDNYENAAPLLERYQLPCTFFVTTQFVESEVVPWWDEDLSSKPKWMSWQQVRQLSESGFAVGSHTLSHPDLGQLVGAGAEREIVDSKAILERHLGRPVNLFSYPYGGRHQMSDANLEIVRKGGYKACCSAFGGIVRAGSDLYRLRRHPISDYHRSAWMYLFELRRQHILGSTGKSPSTEISLYRK